MWQKIDEENPIQGKRVIIQTDEAWVCEAYRVTGGGWNRNDGMRMWESAFGRVVLWQPLPEADKTYVKEK